MKRIIKRLGRNQSGATAIEYAMIALLIALVIISGATLVGKSVSNDFTAAANGIPGSSQ